MLVLGVVIFVPKNADQHQAQDKWNGVEQFRLLILLLLGSFLADIRYIHVLPSVVISNTHILLRDPVFEYADI